MKHEKTFAAIEKLKGVELELHRLKNALEMANIALDAQPAPPPPECEWVGLTDDEVDAAWGAVAWHSGKGLLELRREYARAIEQALKEKNNE